MALPPYASGLKALIVAEVTAETEGALTDLVTDATTQADRASLKAFLGNQPFADETELEAYTNALLEVGDSTITRDGGVYVLTDLDPPTWVREDDSDAKKAGDAAAEAAAEADAIEARALSPIIRLTTSGTGDVITATLPTGMTTYANDQRFLFAPPATNTGAVTLQIGSLAAMPIIDSEGNALQAGDLVSGQFEEIRVSVASSNFRLLWRSKRRVLASAALTGVPTAPTAAVGTNTTQVATAAMVQNEKSRPFATLAPSGTDTLTVAAPAGVTSYTSNQYFKVLIGNRNTGPVTLNIGSIGALPVQTSTGVALASGQLPPGWWEMRCSGTTFRIMEKLPHEIEADLLRVPRLIGQHTLPIDVSNPNTPPLTGSFAGLPVHGFTATGMCRAHNGLWAIANCGVATEALITANNPADFAPSIVFVTPDFRTKVYEILLRPILPNSKIIQGIALDTTNNSYWVADIQGQRFRNISYAGALLGSIELATVSGWDTGGTVNALAYDPVQHGLWCNPQLTDEIYLLDIATQTIVETFTGQPTDIDHFHYDSTTGYLWWTRGNNGSTGLVTIFNTATGTVVSNNNVSQSLAIEGLYYDSALDRLYTVNDAALHVTAGTPPVAYIAEYEFIT